MDNAARKPGSQRGKSKSSESGGNDDPSNLDFLAHPASQWINLIPDEKGWVVIPRKELQQQQYLQILAVDPDDTVLRLSLIHI